MTEQEWNAMRDSYYNLEAEKAVAKSVRDAESGSNQVEQGTPRQLPKSSSSSATLSVTEGDFRDEAPAAAKALSVETQKAITACALQELRACPFCGTKAFERYSDLYWQHPSPENREDACFMDGTVIWSPETWNTRGYIDFDARMHFTYADLWNAYEMGAKDAHSNWKAGPKDFKKAADAYCKLIHAERDPQMFESLGAPSVEKGTEKV